MPASKKSTERHATKSDTTEAVNALMASLLHPLKTEIEAIRNCVLSADSKIKEGVKWNAPSFRTHEYFATTNLRDKQGVGVILHLGAKVREQGSAGLNVADPSGLLTWLAADRASVTFVDIKDFESKKAAFTALIQGWIKQV